eukprot:SAG22_NODE_3725_length_1558_cov_1.354352_2_plen_256_part_01
MNGGGEDPDLNMGCCGPPGTYGQCNQGQTYDGSPDQVCGGSNNWGETRLQVWRRVPPPLECVQAEAECTCAAEYANCYYCCNSQYDDYCKVGYQDGDLSSCEAAAAAINQHLSAQIGGDQAAISSQQRYVRCRACGNTVVLVYGDDQSTGSAAPGEGPINGLNELLSGGLYEHSFSVGATGPGDDVWMVQLEGLGVQGAKGTPAAALQADPIRQAQVLTILNSQVLGTGPLSSFAVSNIITGDNQEVWESQLLTWV